MSQCCTCKNYSTCNDKDKEAIQKLEFFGIEVKCGDYEYQKPLTQEDMRELFIKGML